MNAVSHIHESELAVTRACASASPLIEVDGLGEVEEVTERIFSALSVVEQS